MKMPRWFAAIPFSLLLAVVGTAVADPELDEVRERIAERLEEISPELRPERVERSPVDGLYQAVIGGQVIYVTGDGRYLVQGDMIDLERRQSVSESLRSEARLERLEAHGTENMVIYPAQGDTEHVITVFTDIDCPYCQQMHRNIDEYTSRGIEVRYIQMPRAGQGSNSYRKAVAVWCADDRLEAMDRAKHGDPMEDDSTDCTNPVAEQLQLARELGVNSTPTIITGAGTVRPGLVDAPELREILDEEAAR